MCWDRFDICEAHAVLEWDYNVGGWLQERPSNQRRREATSIQLARMQFRPSPMLSYRSLSENGKRIYHELVRRWNLPAPTGPRRVKLVVGPEGSPNFCFALKDYHTRETVVFAQSDWDYPGLASSLGFVPCECGATDGTVDCEHKTATDMISAAYDWLSERDGECFDCNDYDPE